MIPVSSRGRKRMRSSSTDRSSWPLFTQVIAFFGLLTIDAKPVDGLTSFDQKLLMKYGASLATTFVAQGGVPKINMDFFYRASRIIPNPRHGGELK